MSRFALRDDYGVRPVVVAVGMAVALVAFLAVVIPLANRDARRYAEWCAAQGGHVDSTSDTVTTVGGDGKVHVGTTTTTFCLSSDGRILDVR